MAGEGQDARIEQFDTLRAAAFSMVFLRHTLHLPAGWLGVDLFFVLSGFLITRNLLSLRETTLSNALSVFYFRRLLRIVPPFYVALAVMLALTPLTLRDAPWYFGFASNVRDSLYPAIEGPPVTLWSIAVEEQFYLAWPLLVLLLPERRLAPAFVLVVALAPLVRAHFSPTNPDAVYRLVVSRMDLLAIGALLALRDRREPRWMAAHARGFGLAFVAAALGYGALSAWLPSFRYFRGDMLYDTVGYALSAIGCAGLLGFVRGATWPPLRAALLLPLPRYVGRISYTAYLIHVVAFEQARRLHLPGPLTVAIALALTLGFASASWHLFETRFMRWRNVVPVRASSPALSAEARC